MTDKELKAKIIAEIERLENLANGYYTDRIASGYKICCKDIVAYINSIPEEPVGKNIYLYFKAIPRLLDMIEPSERAKTYINKLADSLDNEGYHVDAKIVREHIKIMNGEKVAMATMDKEPVSEDLEEAAFDYAEACKYEGGEKLLCVEHFKAGANWQKNHLWKPADGDDLPIIDREVIALLDNGKVVFAHRPPEYWDGKNIITGKVTRHYPKTYDKGGWNAPDIAYWLDVKLPK